MTDRASPVGHATDVADEWAAVARVLAPAGRATAMAPAVVAAAAPALAPREAAPAAAPAVPTGWGPTPGWHDPPAAPQPVAAPAPEPADEAAPATPAGAPPREAPPHRPADLRLAMADGAARRDLRRILIAFGAIGKQREAGQAGTPAKPEDVIGAFMTATPDVIDALLRNGGAISDEGRLVRFVAGISGVGRRSDPTDPTAVTAWIAAVGAILRDDASG